jgi:hypothetical protein
VRGKGFVRLAALGAALGALFGGPSPARAATIQVDLGAVAIDDDDFCSLREAFISANKNIARDTCEKGESSTDTIKLGAMQDFFLTGAAEDEDESKEGDLDYTGGGPLVVRGKGKEKTVIQSGITENRAFHALGNASSLTLEDLGVYGGTAPEPESGISRGGNILSESGALSLNRVNVKFGEADNGGGVYFISTEEPRQGIDVRRSTFMENEASDGGGMNINAFDPAEAIVKRSVFEENAAVGGNVDGGAIHSNSRRLEISDSSFLDNRAEAPDGGVALGGAVAITGSLETARVERSLFSANNALLSGDATARGGAVYAAGLGTKVVNTTFYDNESEGVGGALHGRAAVAHSTFLSNHADEAGDHVSATGFPVTLRSSILPGAAIAVDVCADDPDAVSKGFNVFSYDDQDCGTLDSDVTNGGNAGLEGPPANNGGPTLTIAITAESIAKNLIPEGKCKPAGGEDQRGFERPAGPRCDAGAFERGANPG